MIVKFQVNDRLNSWRFYPVSGPVNVCKVDETPQILIKGPDVREEIFTSELAQNGSSLKTFLIGFESGGGKYSVYTENRAFLLNDEGVTVEKLA